MKNSLPAVLIRLFIGLLLAIYPLGAQAATVEWSSLPNRERISIALDPNEGSLGEIARNGVNSVRVSLNQALRDSNELNLSAPAQAALFARTRADDSGITLEIKTPAFGYMINKISPQRVNIDMFSDPTGARWKDQAAENTPPAAPAQTQAATPPAAPGRSPAQPSAAPSVPPTVPAGQLLAPATALPAGAAAQAVRPVPAPVAPAPATQNQATVPAGQPARPVRPAGQPANQSNQANPANPVNQAGQTVPAATQIIAPAVTQAAPAAPTAPAALASNPALNTAPLAQNAPPAPSIAAPQNAVQATPGVRPGAAPVPPVPPVPAVSPQSGQASVGTAPNMAIPSGQPPAASGQTAPAAKDISGLPARDASGSPVKFSINPPGVSVPSVPLGGAGLVTPSGQPSQPAGPPAGQITSPGAQRTPVSAQVVSQNGSVAVPVSGQPVVPEVPAGQFKVSGTTAGNASGNASGNAAGGQASTVGSGESAAQPGQAQNEPEIVYVDEKGNPVAPPPDPKEVLQNIETLIGDGKFQEALATAEELLLNPKLDKEQHEQTLHRKADMIFALHKDDAQAHYTDIVNSTTNAVNYNPDSPRNAQAYLRLGYVNLEAGNRYEATAYFGMLRKQFPNDRAVPLSYFYWGDYLYRQGDLQGAADQYQYVVDNYQDSEYTRDAAIGLAKTYYALGYNDQAYKVVTFIERRWNDYYLNAPSILTLTGDVSMRVNELEKAKLAYWTYYNLQPHAPDLDVVLTRLGDIYTLQKQKKAAEEVYIESMRRFPDSDGGLVAMMRLAEDGVYDAPKMADMFTVFDRSITLKPTDAYNKIITEHPASPLVPLARLKLAMWYLWNKDYAAALDQCNLLAESAPDAAIASRAKEVAMQSFALLTANSVVDERYARVREIWEKYPVLQAQEADLDPESRLGLAASFVNQKNPDAALLILEPFFVGNKNAHFGDMALTLALSIFLEHEQWLKIEDLAAKVELWELKPETQMQLDYALALAYENQDRGAEATVIWQKLYDLKQISPAQLAYVEFFLGRAAENLNDRERAYYLGQDALRLFMESAQKDPAKADNGKIKAQLNSLMNLAGAAGHTQDALNYANMYQQYVDPGSEEDQALQYNKSRIYKRRGNTEEWQKIITELAGKYPASLYGRMAASELRSLNLIKGAGSFSGVGGDL